MKNHIFKPFFSKVLYSLVGILSFLTVLNIINPSSSIFVLASVPPIPTVSPSSASNSINTPYFGLDIKACIEQLDWKAYFASTTPNYNPFVAIGCMSDVNVATNGTRSVTKNTSGQATSVNYNIGQLAIRKTKYSDFTLGNQEALNAFGQIPVLGIFPNGSLPAQNLNAYDIDGTVRGTVQASNRAEIGSLNTIFTSTQLNSLFVKSPTNRSGLERLINTGEERFINQNGGLVYLGGFCRAENGNMVLRSTLSGVGPNGNQLSYNFNPADYNLNNSPITTCGFPSSYGVNNTLVKVCNTEDLGNQINGVNLIDGTCTNVTVSGASALQLYIPLNCSSGCVVNYYDPDGLVRDQKLSVHQNVYKVPFAQNKAQCDDWFPGVFSNYESCLNWFRTRIAVPLTGQNSGNAVCYVETYYGGLNSQKQWIGWENADDYKVRRSFTSQASLTQLQSLYGDDIGYLRQLFGDTTSTDQVILGKINVASDSIKNNYRDYLRAKYEAFVRGADGYSTYLC